MTTEPLELMDLDEALRIIEAFVSVAEEYEHPEATWMDPARVPGCSDQRSAEEGEAQAAQSMAEVSDPIAGP